MKRQFLLRMASFMMFMAFSTCLMAQTNGEVQGTAPENAKAIDLGLPSGTKWANMNVGASEEGLYGLYFAWGETKGYYGVDMTPDLADGRQFKWDFYKWGNGPKAFVTKYCTVPKYGNVDNKKVLDKEDDAAVVNWGGSWRMPTLEEANELLENTTWTAEKSGGQAGFRLVSKINGNSIFLPAGGMRNYGQHQMYTVFGRFWTSTLDEKHPDGANTLQFSIYEKKPKIYVIGRFMGQNVRAVMK